MVDAIELNEIFAGPPPDQSEKADMLVLLQGIVDAQREADKLQAEVNAFLETYAPAIQLAEATQSRDELRKDLETRMIALGVTGVKIPETGDRASITTRHDYKITNDRAFEQAAIDVGKYEDFLTWDMAKVKKFASEYRKENGHSFPGIESIPKSWISVTPAQK